MIQKNYFIFFSLFLSLHLFSQEFQKSLIRIKSNNQNCLDTGNFMYQCSLTFYKKSDSLLNVVYNHIRKGMTQNERNKLKKEQLKWLHQRDLKFKEINNLNTGHGNGLDDLMIKSQKKSHIVNERTDYLISNFLPPQKKDISKSEILKFIPNDYSILDTIKGNLNRDEFSDYILILKKNQENQTSNYNDNKPEKRLLMILTGKMNGELELKTQSENCVFCFDCAGAIHGDPYDNTVIRNGYFSIEHYTTGGINKWSRIITFKYDTSKDTWILHRDGTEFFGFNKNNTPDSEIIVKTGEKILTYKDFGRVNFKDFNIYH